MSFFWKGKPVNTLQLTNKDRLEIVRAGLGSELIVAMVKDRAAQLKKLQGEIMSFVCPLTGMFTSHGPTTEYVVVDPQGFGYSIHPTEAAAIRSMKTFMLSTGRRDLFITTL